MKKRENGTVKWFNKGKHFGFILPEVGGEDVFFHGTEAEKNGLAAHDIRDGMAVSFEASTDRQGRLKAINVMAA